MNLLKRIKKIFKKELENPRNLIEVYRTSEVSDSNEAKKKLEKYKIPFYFVNKIQDMKGTEMLFIFKVPDKYVHQAKEILHDKK